MLEPDLDYEASLKVINKTVDRTGVQERTGDVALMHSPAKLRHPLETRTEAPSKIINFN